MAQNFTALAEIEFNPMPGYERTPFYEVVVPQRTPTLRDRLEAEIDRLIDMLNALDGDTDYEPSAGFDYDRDDSDIEEFSPLSLNEHAA